MDGGELLAGRYELRGILGCGGMAEVRDGRDTRLQRPVAIKLLLPGLCTHPDTRRRFADEARSAAGLNHPNIVSVHDFGEHHGTPFIVMERLPGATLADKIGRGPLRPAEVRAILDDVLAALAVAHRAGVLHRDIKPGNILASATGTTMKVADFGIAKSAGAALTTTGQIAGTMAYMSPERIAGAPASPADDLYALGLVGYEALTGRRVFAHDNPAALAHAVMTEPPPQITMVRPDVDPALAGAIDRAMRRDAAQRFHSADQMRSALMGDRTALLAPPRPAVGVVRPPTQVLAEPLAPSATWFVPPSPPRRNVRVRTLAAAAAVLSAVVIAVFALALDSPTPQQPPRPVDTSTTVSTAAPSPAPAPPVVSTAQNQDPGPIAPPRPGHKPGRGHKGD